MLPGKIYTPEDILGIARQRVWLLLLPFAVVSACTALWVYRLPDRYRSESAILVVPQRVPESYVRSTVTMRLQDRLQSIQQQIMSRTRLEQIITEFNLYQEERKTQLMEDIVQRMRTRDVHTEVVRGDAFRISFEGPDPRTVMMVTEKLASLFIDENLEDRARMAQNTNQFLETQLQEAKQRLVEQEKKLEVYKLSHAGQLPTQLESNLQVLQNAQIQLQDVLQTLNRERATRTRLERDIADLEQQIEDESSFVPGSLDAADGLAKQLDALNATLSELLLTKTNTHPEVKRTRASINELEQKIAARQVVQTDLPVSRDLRRLPPAESSRLKRLENMKLDLGLVSRNIENGEREQQRLYRNIAAYQARNEGIPVRETEMTELLRDYETLNQMYLGLLEKREDSKMSASLESRQIGETFKVIDPARIAERPVSPNRPLYNGMGAIAGLIMGGLLVGLGEYRDKSFKTDAEVTRVLTLPVLAVVPMMQSAVEQKRAFRNRLMMGVGFGTTVAACIAVVLYTLAR